MKTRGLLHLNLNVSDLARSVRFRRELFGLEVVATSDGDEEIDGRHVRISQVVLRTPGTRELFALTQAAPRPAPRVPPKLSARAPFKTAAFDHSATSPLSEIKYLAYRVCSSGAQIRSNCAYGRKPRNSVIPESEPG